LPTVHPHLRVFYIIQHRNPFCRRAHGTEIIAFSTSESSIARSVNSHAERCVFFAAARFSHEVGNHGWLITHHATGSLKLKLQCYSSYRQIGRSLLGRSIMIRRSSVDDNNLACCSCPSASSSLIESQTTSPSPTALRACSTIMAIGRQDGLTLTLKIHAVPGEASGKEHWYEGRRQGLNTLVRG
jgi:hypothetical protein